MNSYEKQIKLSLATYGGGYMLQIRNLNITHLKDDRVLLQNLSFSTITIYYYKKKWGRDEGN